MSTKSPDAIVTTEKKLDPAGGEPAFKALEPRLRALPAASVFVVNLDVPAACVAAFAACELMRDGGREARVKAMPDFDQGLVDRLEQQAWCTIYLHNLVKNSKASANGQKVDAATVESAFALRARMQRVLDYHFVEDTKVQAELADIRAGSGHRDLATDLGRLAELYVQHASKLSIDKVQYDEGDVGRARGFVQAIMRSLTTALLGPSDEIDDLRTRSLNLLVQDYTELKAAHDWVNRKDSREAEALPHLRTAVLAQLSRKRGTEEEQVPAPDGAPDKPSDPKAPAPTPPADGKDANP